MLTVPAVVCLYLKLIYKLIYIKSPSLPMTQSRETHRGRRVGKRVAYGHLAAVFVGAVLLCTPLEGQPQAAGMSKRLVFRGYTVANAINDGCYGPTGIYVSIDARASAMLSPARVRQMARASRPKHAQVRIGGRSYRLVIDRRTSGRVYDRVWWTFKRVEASKSAARKLIGKKVTVSYMIGSRTYKTKLSKVYNGSCE